MTLTFLGTRGNISARSKYHYRHSSLLITYRKTRILIDWGKDWRGKKLSSLHPDAIFITHAHDDHVDGLKQGTDIPVCATKQTWQRIKNYPLAQRTVIRPNRKIIIGSLNIVPFAVWHSINAPAVGYKISDGDKTIFYVSDLVKIKNQKAALKGVDVYIGDGAIVTRTLLVRKKDSELVGHAPIVQQLSWCKKEKVPRMIVTHCGTEITTSHWDAINKRLKVLGKKYGMKIQLAYDGWKILL